MKTSTQRTGADSTQISDEIQKLKYKDPSSTKIVQLEQELVRAEAQSLVAEAQLTNITRQKFKEAYDLHTAAIIERAEKQILLAKQARQLVNLLDDTPIVPGDAHQSFAHTEHAREVLNTAEDDLRRWEPSIEPIHTQSGALGSNAMPGSSFQESPASSRVPTFEQEQQQELQGHESMEQAPFEDSEYTQSAAPVHSTVA